MATKAASPSSSPGVDLIRRALYLPIGLAAVYLTFFLALLTPAFQRHFIFLHAIQFPLFANFNQPEKYGLAPFKTRPLTLTTADGERIGAWHVLPEIHYQSQTARSAVTTEERKERASDKVWEDEVYDEALRRYPTILYLHGNSMNRAAPFRIAAYTALTSRIDANVVAIDYRGFGDSTGTPSEDGLVEDAHAAYRWIQSHNSPSIILFGQSLGTGISALLASKLELESSQSPPSSSSSSSSSSSASPPDGLVLMAPYTNLKNLVKDFKIGGLLPVLAPINAIPFNNRILDYFLQTHLNTLETLPSLTQPHASHRTNIVILHAADDPVIPITHSHQLFTSLLHHSNNSTVQHRSVFNSFARIKRFTPSQAPAPAPASSSAPRNDDAKVTLIETQFGGHNQLTEGALDLVRLALRLPSHLTPPS